MNPVLILTHNNLELTKRCVESGKIQDVGDCYPEIIDNGSSDETVAWVTEYSLLLDASPFNTGVSAGWNRGLSELFTYKNIHHVLVVGNDTVLPPWFYRELLSYNVPFITGVAVCHMDQLIEPQHRSSLEPHPDFSAFLIRRDCWEKVGPFDERMKHYCSDCDFHVRAHRLGIPLVKACVPYYHERSSTLRLAPPAEQQEIQAQANRDRDMFRSIYGCIPGEKAYESLFL